MNEQRITFNWGYWDGAALASRPCHYPPARQRKHPAPLYREGMLYGYRAAQHEEIGESSEAAWQDFQLWSKGYDDEP